jgi:tape measure domain-containing protein
VEAASVEVVFKANLDNLRKSIAQAEKQLVDFNKRAAALANIGARGGSSLLPGGRNSVSDALAQKQMANATTATNAYVRATNNLSASVGRLNGALGPLQTQLAKIGTSTTSVNTATNAMSRTYSRVPAQVNQTRASFVSLSGALQGVAAAYGAFQGLQGFKSLLDTSNRINNSLRVIGHEGQDLIDTYNTLFESAQRNFTSVEALTTLYSRLGLAQNELGKNSQEIMDFTDRVALALRVQGTSAQEARGALIQLTQAMGSGIVRAEEFNSIVEGAPSILRATARGLEEAGGSVAKLRTIVIDGELSSRAFFEAFMLGSEGLADLVEDNVVTIDQAYSRFYNSLFKTANEIDSSVGVTQALTTAISQLSDELTGLGNWFTDNTSEIRAFFEEMDKLGKLLNDFNKAAYDLGYTIGENLGIHDAVRGLGASVERALDPVTAAVDETMDRVGEARRELLAFAEALVLNADTVDPLIAARFQEIIDKLVWGKISAEEAKVAIDNLSGISPDFSNAVMGIQGMITNFGNLINAANAARAAMVFSDIMPSIQGGLGAIGGAIGNWWKGSSGSGAGGTTSIRDNPVLNKPSKGGRSKKSPAQSLQEEIEKIREKIALNQVEIDLLGKSTEALDTARTRQDLLNRAKQLGIKLTEEQLKEIESVSVAYGKSQQEVENMNKALEQQESLVSEFASIVGELFSKPIKDADEFFDTIFSGFARLGQANLQNSLEGLFDGTGLWGSGGEAAVDPTTKIANAVQKGAQKGTETGTSTGLGDFFGGLFGGGEGGQSGIASVLSAGAGGLGIGYQTQDPIMGALGGALSGISGGPVGIAVGALGGLIGGLFGMNKALQEAQEKLAKVRGEIDSFVDVGEGRGLGQLTQALRDYYDKSYEYQELAMKAGDGALQKRLQEAANSFFFFIEKDFKLGFEGTIESLSSGQGLSGAFVSAQQSIIGLREELKGFIADTDYIGNKALNVEDDPATAERVRRAQEAAQQFVLSILSGAEELTEFEKATEEANGKASALQVTLEQLGMASEDAARAIEQALGMAIAKLRDEYATDINNSINELSGFGFINEIVEAQVKYQERLRDAQALGLDGASALQELNLSLASVARSAGLTQTQIDILAKTFPQMAGLIELLAGEDTQQNLAKAQAQLRSAYDAQARSLETTIGNLNRFITSLQKFRENLRLDGALSPLTPLQRLQEAQMQFQQTMSAALTGDEEALGRVEDVSRQYLEEARAYYGTSANYFAIFEEVEALLGNVENVAKNQLTETQKELTLLQEQVGKLIDIDNSVMSVADAIAALQLAQAASDAALAAQLAALAMTNQNAIAQIYQNVLGRDPDAGGLAYYQNQMNQGKTSGQIEDTIRKSNEYRLQQLYQSILGRRGDAEGLAYWSRELDRGVTIEQIAEEFMRNKSIGQFATGGFHGGGLRIVGENGPELEMTGPSRIWSAQQTSNFVSAANSNSSAETLRELQALRQEVSQLRAGQNQGNQIAASGFSATVNATQENTQVAKQQATNNWQNNYRRFA